MRKTVFRILVILILTLLTLQPLSVQAAESVDITRDCSLGLDYSSNGTGFSDLEIRLYRVAEFYADGTYSLISPFDELPVKIYGIQSQKEWQDAANTLAAYITAEKIQPTITALTDHSGKAEFSNLKTGVYLVPGLTVETDSHFYRFEDFCVFLPRPQSDGSLDYHLTAKPKYSVTPKPVEPEIEHYQVVKLWKDASIRKKRPKRISVSILKNGILQETVQLNKDNNWAYSWSAPRGKDVWTVVETDVPDAYTVVITESGTTFTITNTYPTPQELPPKTGDTFALRPWLTVMSLSGILLMVCGIRQKRKTR